MRPRRSRSLSFSATTSTGRRTTSAWNCIRNALRLAPPSARRTSTPAGCDSRTSATWCAIPSSVARAMWPRVVPPEMPAISPRASASQCGVPSPASAGTNMTPPVDPASTASRSASSGPETMPSPSRSHVTAAPLVSTEPSIAYCTARHPARPRRRSSAGPAVRARRCRRRSRARTRPSRTSPSPRAARSSPGRTAPPAGRRRVPAIGTVGAEAAPPRRRRRSSRRPPGSRRTVDAEQREQLVVPRKRSRCRRASCAMRSSGRSRARGRA